MTLKFSPPVVIIVCTNVFVSFLVFAVFAIVTALCSLLICLATINIIRGLLGGTFLPVLEVFIVPSGTTGRQKTARFHDFFSTGQNQLEQLSIIIIVLEHSVT